MEQNYKRLAAATMAALFVGNIVPETLGMETQQISLQNGENITLNRTDPISVFNAFKQAMEARDFPSARALRKTIAGFGSFSEKDDEMDDIIVEAINYKPPFSQSESTVKDCIQNRADIMLKSLLSPKRRLLLELNKVSMYNFGEAYQACSSILQEIFSRSCADYSAVTSVLENVSPETNDGKALKDALLKEWTLLLQIR